jgi:DNA-directed RNA polymerase specialized sigma24 family protein
VWTALAELPTARRKAIERAYFGGLTHVQIGRAFGVPSAA